MKVLKLSEICFDKSIFVGIIILYFPFWNLEKMKINLIPRQI